MARVYSMLYRCMYDIQSQTCNNWLRVEIKVGDRSHLTTSLGDLTDCPLKCIATCYAPAGTVTSRNFVESLRNMGTELTTFEALAFGMDLSYWPILYLLLVHYASFIVSCERGSIQVQPTSTSGLGQLVWTTAAHKIKESGQNNLASCVHCKKTRSPRAPLCSVLSPNAGHHRISWLGENHA
jgi:hypothetical protein